MIFVRLKGGLGNQMFQYAAARQLSVMQGVPLKLDISLLQSQLADRTKRDFELDKFNIHAEIANLNEIAELKKKTRKNFFQLTQIRERYFGFIKTFLKTGNTYYINGYWQSEKYFENISEIIRNEFVFKKPLVDEYFISLQHQIAASNSVSVHFRRGDYVSDKKTNQYHGTCSIEYYQKAVKLLTERVKNPQLFVFSDDILWVKSHFHTEFPVVFVEKSNDTEHSDFRLMSLCKHNVIANSSYSWWAAWLNSNEDKIVIAPKQWYTNKRKQLHSGDRIPKRWLKI